MPDTGTQQPLPFPHRPTQQEAFEAAFPLASERAVMARRIEAFRHLLGYQQGLDSASLAGIIAIQAEIVRVLEAYISDLEKALRKESGPEAAAAPRRKRTRRKP
jgi:hypothetical protein